MEDLYFIDANCSFGLRKKAYPFSMTQKDEVKRELQKCNVAKAICHHSSAREFHPGKGNEILLQEIKGDDFFLPAFVLVPNFDEDFYTDRELSRLLSDNHVSLVKIFPDRGEQSFSVADWMAGKLFSQLGERNIPVMVPYRQVGADGLRLILQEQKNVKVIMTDTSYFNDKELMRLLSLYENLYLETSNYTTLDGIEYVTETFGSRRLVFGSGLPLVSVGAAVAKIIYAGIGKEDKHQIAHGNIEAMMKEVKRI